MTKRKKIKYIPGIISLIVLPIISIYYLKSVGAFIQYRTIEINMPRESEKGQILEFKRTHYFNEFRFSKDDITNNKTVMQIDSVLYSLKILKDTNNGVVIQFEDLAKYSYFIQTLNLLFKHNYETYLVEENEIWAVWNVPITHNIEPRTYISCGTQNLIYRKNEQDYYYTVQKETKEKFISNLMGLWIVGAAYFALIGLSIFRLRKLLTE